MTEFAGALSSCPAGVAVVSLLLSNLTLPSFPPSTTCANEEFDIIVVGGGSAGSVVASRLSERKDLSVLLLEAGPEEPEVASIPGFYAAELSLDEYHWHIPTQKSDGLDSGQTISRAKMMGGCGAHNGLYYVRGSKYDYVKWLEQGATGWNHTDVLPYFKKMENQEEPYFANDTFFHSTGGPLDVGYPPYRDRHIAPLLAALQNTSLELIDYDASSDEGCFELELTVGRDGQRRSPNRAYIMPNRHRRNLRVITNALVRKINIDNVTKQAESVEYVDRDGNVQTVYAKKEVVLSAGVYLSPQILMLSGVGPAAHLEEAGIDVVLNRSGVGEHLVDHFTSTFTPVINLSVIPTSEEVFQDAWDFSNGKGVWTSKGPGGVALMKRLSLQPEDDLRPYLQAQITPGWSNESLVPDEFCYPVTKTVGYYDQLTMQAVLLHPSSTGYVRLNTTSPYSLPLVYQNVFSNETDILRYAEGAKWVWDNLNTSAPLLAVNGSVSLPEYSACDNYTKYSLEYFACGVRNAESTSYGHGAGTCRMGAANDSSAVVDPELRVIGVGKLRVIDASVFPAVTSGNTNIPTMMVAERGADFIKAAHPPCDDDDDDDKHEQPWNNHHGHHENHGQWPHHQNGNNHGNHQQNHNSGNHQQGGNDANQHQSNNHENHHQQRH